MNLSGKRVVITGGASGMGRRIALECARRGADVVVWDLDRERIASVVAEIASSGATGTGDVCNVADRSQVYAAARRIEAERGPVDVLVCCAGVVSGKPFLELADEQVERTFAVNTLALFWAAKAFLPGMVARNRGHIVTLASASGLIGVSKLSDYASSKWAAIGFDESLRVELRKLAPGVGTTVVCPYYVNTGMFTGVKSRFPWLMPILEEADVATRTVDAIEKGRRRLIMPWSVAFLPLMRMLPVPIFDALANFLGVNRSMDEFVGRAPAAPAVEHTSVPRAASGERR
jgi:all-trans-retinol dehydrogenase (NAD+)